MKSIAARYDVPSAFRIGLPCARRRLLQQLVSILTASVSFWTSRSRGWSIMQQLYLELRLRFSAALRSISYCRFWLIMISGAALGRLERKCEIGVSQENPLRVGAVFPGGWRGSH